MFKIVALLLSIASGKAEIIFSQSSFDTKELCEIARPDSIAELTPVAKDNGFSVEDSRCVSVDDIHKTLGQKVNE